MGATPPASSVEILTSKASNRGESTGNGTFTPLLPKTYMPTELSVTISRMLNSMRGRYRPS
jgi:hypothetical protein